jgi:putative molybdopterin biosynthesis protein
MLWAAAWKIFSGCFLKKTSLRGNGRTPQRFQKTPQEAVSRQGRSGWARDTLSDPVVDLGEVLNYAVPRRRPSGSLPWGSGQEPPLRRVACRFCLLRDRRVIEQEIAVAGCDPSVFLAGDYLRRHQGQFALWWDGISAVPRQLKRSSGERCTLRACTLWMRSPESLILPYLRRHLKRE